MRYLEHFIFREIRDHGARSTICDSVLRSLPDWYGIEEAIVDYTKGVIEGRFIAVFDDENHIGFISIHETSTYSNEVYVMGILKEFHRIGIGQRLIEKAIEISKKEGKKFLLVKTLSSKHPDKHYAKTRKFYEGVGFIPLEELPDLWGKENPCLNMIIAL